MAKQQSRSPVVTISLVTAICLLGDSMLYIALPLFWQEIGLDSLWQVGILLSINRLIRLPFNPIIGWVYQRISLQTGLIIAVILGTITTAGYGVVSGFLGWLILRALWGVAWSFLRIGGLTAVTTYTNDDNRGQTMGVYNGLYRLGSLFGMLFGGILAPFIGIQNVALLFGLCTIFALFYLLHSFSKVAAGKPRQSGRAKVSMPSFHLPKGTATVLVSGFFIALLFQGILTSTLSPLIGQLFGEPVPIAGILISVTALSGLIQSARWLWEPFLARSIGAWSDGARGRKPLFIFSLVFAAFTVFALPFSMPVGIWLIVSLLVLLAATSLTTLSDALASDLAKRTNAVSFFTIYTITQDVGAAIGPLVSYFVITLPLGFAYLYISHTLILLVLALVWFRIYRKHKKSGAEVH